MDRENWYVRMLNSHDLTGVIDDDTAFNALQRMRQVLVIVSFHPVDQATHSGVQSPEAVEQFPPPPFAKEHLGEEFHL